MNNRSTGPSSQHSYLEACSKDAQDGSLVFHSFTQKVMPGTRLLLTPKENAEKITGVGAWLLLMPQPVGVATLTVLQWSN